MKRTDFLRMTGLMVTVLILALSTPRSQGAILGIDYGSQWIKAAVLRPGFFDVVENEVNKRKTSAALSFAKQDNERILGKTALRVLFRSPERAFVHTAELLGKPYNPSLPRKYYPYEVVADPARGTNTFKLAYSDAIQNISAEEVSGIILKYVKEFSEKYAKVPLTDCVITVKSYATVHEKAALIDAARLAGLNVLGLISAPAAFAVTYGMEKAGNETQNLAIVDMGDSSLEVAYAAVTDSKGARKSGRSTAAVTVKSVDYEKTLGGREFVGRLTEIVLRKMGLEKEIINYRDRRNYYRVESYAEKIMEVLSVNKEAVYKISFPERDYEGVVTRDEFEAATRDLVERVAAPLRRGLERANWTAADVTYVQIVGGATRIPAVQAAIRDALGKKDLQRHLSSDEGAAFGAAYLGAHLSTLHRMKKDLALKDIAPYSVEATVNGKTFTLFKEGSKYGSKKTLTLYNKKDFGIKIAYAENSSIEPGLCREIENITVSGIPSKDNYNMTEDPKLQIQITLKHTGLIEVTKAHSDIHEIVYVEETVKKKKKKAKKNETADGNNAANDENKTVEEVEIKNENTQNSNDVKENVNEKENEKDVKNDKEVEKDVKNEEGEKEEEEEEGEEKEEEKNNNDDDDDKEEENDDDEEEGEEAEKEEKEKEKEKEEKKKKEEVKKILKPVKKFHSIKLKVTTEALCLKPLTTAEFAASSKKLAAFDQADQDRRDLAEAKNNLEEYIFQTRETLSTPESREALAPYCAAGTLDEIEQNLSAAFAWLEDEEDGEATKIDVLREKLRDLRREGDAILFRKAEAEERPDAIRYLRVVLNFTRHAIANATVSRNISDEAVQLKYQKCDEIEKWLNESIKRQEEVPLSERPVVLVSDIDDKIDDLKIVVKWLNKQPRKKKEKKQEPAGNETASGNETVADNNNTEEKNAETAEAAADAKAEAEAEKKETSTTEKKEEEEKKDNEKDEL